MDDITFFPGTPEISYSDPEPKLHLQDIVDRQRVLLVRHQDVTAEAKRRCSGNLSFDVRFEISELHRQADELELQLKSTTSNER
jgi:hypothetical protein